MKEMKYLIICFYLEDIEYSYIVALTDKRFYDYVRYSVKQNARQWQTFIIVLLHKTPSFTICLSTTCIHML